MSNLQTYHIEGLSCAACAVSSQKVLQKTQGVALARVNFATKTATVEFQASDVSLDVLNQRLQKLGFQLFERDRAHRDERKLAEQLRLQQFQRHLLLSIALGIPLIIIGMFLHHAAWAGWAMFALSTPILLVAGFPFYRNAWQQLLVGQSNMDTLVALGTGISYLFSVFNILFPSVLLSAGLEPHLYFETAGGLITFILVGKFLEERAKRQTGQAIEALLNLQPPTVQILLNNELKTLPIEAVQLNDVVLVRAGDQIPLDGVVIQGESEVNESMLTGEPLPIAKKIGDAVYAGTLNQLGTLHICVEKLPDDTILAQIIRLVEQAQASQAPVQQLVDKIAAVFVPSIVVISLLTLLVWAMLGNPQQGIIAFISILVVACPCALGLATPTAIVVGIGRAAQLGILLKGAKTLEIAPKIDALVVDKTGTLTEGKPSVQGHFNGILSGADNAVLDSVIFSIENASSHPLAEAICRYLNEKNPTIALVTIENSTTLAGNGIECVWQGDIFRVGKWDWLQRLGISLPIAAEQWANAPARQGLTFVWVARNQELVAVFALSDTIRASSAAALAELRQLGIQIHLATGDNAAAAQQVASALGIESVNANVLPSDKINLVRQLQAAGHCVAMLGDGINDAPALAQADWGIAMNNGTDVAVESADVVLLQNDLHHVAASIRLARSTVRIIWQNLGWAFIYNLLMIPLAAGALSAWGWQLHPMLAGGAMALSSVSVVLNSLRLRWK